MDHSYTVLNKRKTNFIHCRDPAANVVTQTMSAVIKKIKDFCWTPTM